MRKRQSNYVKWARKVRGEPEPVVDYTSKVYTGLYCENGLYTGAVVRFVEHPSRFTCDLYPVGEEHTLYPHPSSGRLVDGNKCNGYDAAYVVVRRE